MLSALRGSIRRVSLAWEVVIKVKIWRVSSPVEGEWSRIRGNIYAKLLVGGSTDFWALEVGQDEGERGGGKRVKVGGQGPGCAGLCLSQRFGRTGIACASLRSEFPVRLWDSEVISHESLPFSKGEPSRNQLLRDTKKVCMMYVAQKCGYYLGHHTFGSRCRDYSSQLWSVHFSILFWLSYDWSDLNWVERP